MRESDITDLLGVARRAEVTPEGDRWLIYEGLDLHLDSDEGYRLVSVELSAPFESTVAGRRWLGAADVEELIPMVEIAEANTEEKAGEVLADAGYRSKENFSALENAKIDGHVPIGRKRKPESNDDDAPIEQSGSASSLNDAAATATKNDDASTKQDDTATKRMKSKLRTKHGRERYRRRKHLVESPFGWVKHVLGFRSFSLRGSANVQGEWNLVCVALNLRRMQWMEA